jgi:hypothetical protein
MILDEPFQIISPLEGEVGNATALPGGGLLGAVAYA